MLKKVYNGISEKMKIKLIPERLDVLKKYPNAEISKKLFRFEIKNASMFISDGKNPREAWKNAKKSIEKWTKEMQKKNF